MNSRPLSLSMKSDRTQKQVTFPTDIHCEKTNEGFLFFFFYFDFGRICSIKSFLTVMWSTTRQIISDNTRLFRTQKKELIRGGVKANWEEKSTRHSSPVRCVKRDREREKARQVLIRSRFFCSFLSLHFIRRCSTNKLNKGFCDIVLDRTAFDWQMNRRE